MVEQRGLADAGLAPQDEYAAACLPGAIEKSIDERALGVPPIEHVTNCSSRCTR
jgi:hypothetical protein